MQTACAPSMTPSPAGCTSPVWNLGFRPCRRCAACRLREQEAWAKRAQFEAQRSGWPIFATWTLRPRGRMDVNKVDHLGDVQKVIKRMRKDGLRIRYLGAPELGSKGGRIHYHLLFHGLDKVVTARNYWRQGYTHARRAKLSDLQYVAKYVVEREGVKKGSRVLASLNYGNPYSELKDDETTLAVFRVFRSAKVSSVGGIHLPYAVRSTATQRLRKAANLEGDYSFRVPQSHGVPRLPNPRSLSGMDRKAMERDCPQSESNTRHRVKGEGATATASSPHGGAACGPSEPFGGAP